MVASGRGHHACQGGRERVWSCPGGRGAGPLGKKGWAKKKKKAYSTRYSQAVSHPSTNQARPCLASEIRRDRARSGWYGRRRSAVLLAAPRARAARARFCAACLRAGLCAAVRANPSPRPPQARVPLRSAPGPGTHHAPLPDHPNTPRPLARPNSAWPFRRQPALGPATHQRAGRTARSFFQTAPAPAPAQDTPMLPAPQARHLGWPGPSAQRSAGSAEPAPACRASGPGALSSSPLRAAPRPGPTPARATRCSSPALGTSRCNFLPACATLCLLRGASCLLWLPPRATEEPTFL